MRVYGVACLLTALTSGAAAQGFRDDFHRAFAAVPEGWGHGPIPDDGSMHVNGDWNSTYCKDAGPVGMIAQQNVRLLAGPPRLLALTVHAGTCDAAEITSNRGWSFDGGGTFPYGRTGYGYGYYEAELKTGDASGDGEHGGVNSFFVRGAAGSGGALQSPEIDFEFLTDEDWDVPGSKTGRVHLSVTGISGDAISKGWKLPFDPSAGFHRYGFQWQPGSATFFVDGAQIAHYDLADLTLPASGMIVMANNWTGTRSWGGIPPLRDETALYRSIRYDPAARPP